jgi:hypothetical protein
MNQAEIDRANAAYYERTAAEEFAKGNICWGLYFLDAADFWAAPTPQAESARIELLQDAMGQLDERTADR